jgi:tyrosine-protein phosphatase SIW14
MSKVVNSLEAAKNASNNDHGFGKPLNFGVVLPGTVYRSSFPRQEDFKFFQGLGLKTIV